MLGILSLEWRLSLFPVIGSSPIVPGFQPAHIARRSGDAGKYAGRA